MGYVERQALGFQEVSGGGDQDGEGTPSVSCFTGPVDPLG